MKKLLLLSFLVIALTANARQISESEAASIAAEFLGSTPALKNAPKPSMRRVRGQNVGNDDNAPFYVFNTENNQGFVIVAGDDRAKKILGYSDKGSFDFNNLPPQLEELLNRYTECLKKLPAETPTDISWKATPQSISDDGGVLLETAEWNQFMPYNAYCPEIDGMNPPTGCTNTAQAILMKYHKWPIQGKGTVGYTWNGKNLKSNLSESTYDWDKMRNQYDNNGQDLTDEEINPIATLFRDVSFANETYFALSGSGASYNISALVHNFSYAPKWRDYSREWMTNEKLFFSIKSELDNGRPCLVVSATTPVGGGAHAYVCDGYDSNRYLHYNFGWSGYCNGYYSLEPIDNFPSADISFIGGIEPDKGNISEEDCLYLSAYLQEPFTFNGKDIQCRLQVDFGFFNRVITIGVAFENISDHSKNITEIKQGDWTFYNVVDFIELDFLKQNTFLKDGEYIIYPVVK